MLRTKSGRQLYGQCSGQGFQAEDLAALGAFEVGVFVNFTAGAGIEAPGAVFIGDPVCQCLFDQPVQCAIQGYAVKFAVMAESFGYFKMSERTFRIEQGGQDPRACGCDAATSAANEEFGIHAGISA